MASKKQGLIYLRNSSNTELSFQIKRENITTERNFKINEQEMYSNTHKHHRKNYYNNGDSGLTFSCVGLFTSKQTKTMKLLDSWYLTMTPFSIVFGKHLNIKLPLISKKWIITKLSLKQESDDFTEWDITFSTYYPPKNIKKVKNTFINRSTKSYKWKVGCKKHYKNLNYKKQAKKKFPKSECVKTLNSIMIELGYMKKLKKKVKTKKKDKKGKTIYKKVKYVPNTWVHGKKNKGNTTSRAIKKFKKDWNKHKLKPAFKKNKKGQWTDTISAKGYKNIANYKQLKSAKKKK